VAAGLAVIVDTIFGSNTAQDGGETFLPMVVDVTGLRTTKNAGDCSTCMVGLIGIYHLLQESGCGKEGRFFQETFQGFQRKSI